MATKAQAEKAIEKIGGKLVEESGGETWIVQLEAPYGHHWSDADIHARPVFWFRTPGEKSEYWDEVMSQISELGHPQSCVGGCCATQDGVCDVWGIPVVPARDKKELVTENKTLTAAVIDQSRELGKLRQYKFLSQVLFGSILAEGQHEITALCQVFFDMEEDREFDDVEAITRQAVSLFKSQLMIWDFLIGDTEDLLGFVQKSREDRPGFAEETILDELKEDFGTEMERNHQGLSVFSSLARAITAGEGERVWRELRKLFEESKARSGR